MLRTTQRDEKSVRYLMRNGALVGEGRFGNVPRVDFYRITRCGSRLLKNV